VVFDAATPSLAVALAQVGEKIITLGDDRGKMYVCPDHTTPSRLIPPVALGHLPLQSRHECNILMPCTFRDLFHFFFLI
jgi:hypothetical protein